MIEVKHFLVDPKLILMLMEDISMSKNQAKKKLVEKKIESKMLRFLLLLLIGKLLLCAKICQTINAKCILIPKICYFKQNKSRKIMRKAVSCQKTTARLLNIHMMIITCSLQPGYI